MILRNGISEKTIDLVNEDRILRMNEMRLRIFFDAIRKQNNKFVLKKSENHISKPTYTEIVKKVFSLLKLCH